MSNLRHLDTPTLLRHAYADQDDLTTSDLERELLRRLEVMTDNEAVEAVLETEFSAKEIRTLGEAMSGSSANDADKVAALLNALEDSCFAPDHLIEVLKLLTTKEITEVSELQNVLELAAKFQDIANDLAEVLPRLSTLITETQE